MNTKYNEKYTYDVLSEAVSHSKSVMGVLRYLDIPCAGGTHSHVKRKIVSLGIDTSHFTGQAHNKGGLARNRKSAFDVLTVLPIGSARPKVTQLKRALLESGLTYQCVCGIIDEWQGKPIRLEIDHIDGNWLNNKIDNLRFLCPNCHSQQETTNRPHKYARVVERNTHYA